MRVVACSSDPRDRRLGAASADAAAGARGARRRAGARRARRPGVGSGRLLRRADGAGDPDPVAARRRPAAARAARCARSAPTSCTRISCTPTSTAASPRSCAASRSSRRSTTTIRSGSARSATSSAARAARRSHRDDHRVAAAVHGRRGRDPGGEGRDDPLRARRAPRAVGRESARRRADGRARAARRRAAHGAEGHRRRRARASVAAGRHRSRRPRRGARSGARSRRWRGSSASSAACSCRAACPTWPPGSAARRCSSTRRAGRASASACSRRCSPACPSSRRTSARCRSSSSTARPASSSGPTTRARSRVGIARALDAPGARRRPACARARAEFSVARMADARPSSTPARLIRLQNAGRLGGCSRRDERLNPSHQPRAPAQVAAAGGGLLDRRETTTQLTVHRGSELAGCGARLVRQRTAFTSRARGRPGAWDRWTATIAPRLRVEPARSSNDSPCTGRVAPSSSRWDEAVPIEPVLTSAGPRPDAPRSPRARRQERHGRVRRGSIGARMRVEPEQRRTVERLEHLGSTDALSPSCEVDRRRAREADAREVASAARARSYSMRSNSRRNAHASRPCTCPSRRGREVRGACRARAEARASPRRPCALVPPVLRRVRQRGTAAARARAAPTSSRSAALERALVQQLGAVGAELLQEARERAPPPRLAHPAREVEVAGETDDRGAQRLGLAGAGRAARSRRRGRARRDRRSPRRSPAARAPSPRARPCRSPRPSTGRRRRPHRSIAAWIGLDVAEEVHRVGDAELAARPPSARARAGRGPRCRAGGPAGRASPRRTRAAARCDP